MLASLTIGAHEWVWPALLIFGAGSALAVWGYTRVNAAPGARLAAFILRIVGLAALAACLLDPLWTDTQPRPGANVFAIVADNSQGMEIKDLGATKTRGAQLRDLVAQDKAPWQIKLAET